MASSRQFQESLFFWGDDGEEGITARREGVGAEKRNNRDEKDKRDGRELTAKA